MPVAPALDVEETPDAFLYADIVKRDVQPDGSVVVYGKPSNEALDIDEQRADKEWLQKALPEWYRWGNVREMHGPRAVGTAQKLEWDENDEPWLTAKIVDKEAAHKVREGVYKGFSIGIRKPILKHDRNAPKGRFVGGTITEVSVVDRPANPDSGFKILKRAGANEWVDMQTGFTLKVARQSDGAETVPGVAGSAQTTSDRDRAGNVHDPADGNSVDFDSMGNPILQPGHIESNAADISIVTMDERGMVVAVGDEQYLVSYTTNSAGQIVFGEPELMPSQQPSTLADGSEPRKGVGVTDQIIATYDEFAVVERWQEGAFYKMVAGGEPERIEWEFTPVDTANKMAGEIIKARRALIADLGKGVWSSAEIDDLPDSAFAYVEPGGEKKDGKTEPKSKRHLPFKGKDGKADAAHVRNALARLDQTDIPDSAKAEAKRKLEAAAREVGVDVDDKAEKAARIIEAATKAVKERAHCPECRKTVKLAEKVSEKDGEGGKHGVWKGECGHQIKRFEAAEKCDKCGEAMEAEHKCAVEKCAECGEDKGDEHKCATKAAPPDGQDAGDQTGGHEGEGEDPNNRIDRTNPQDAEEAKKAAAFQSAVNVAVAEALKAAGLDVGKSARQSAVAQLREHTEALSALVETAEKGILGTHGNPKGEGEAPPDPVDMGVTAQRITEEVGAISELARRVAASEGDLFHEGGQAGNLGPENRWQAPTSLPGGRKIDQSGTEPAAPHGSGMDDMHKGVDMAEAFKAAMPDIAKSMGAEIERVVGPLAQQVARLSKQPLGVTRADIYVQEHPEQFGQTSPQVSKMAADQVRADISKLSPEEQQRVAALLVAQARQGQR